MCFHEGIPTAHKKHKRHVRIPALSFRQIVHLGLSATLHHSKMEGGNAALNALGAFLLRSK